MCDELEINLTCCECNNTSTIKSSGDDKLDDMLSKGIFEEVVDFDITCPVCGTELSIDEASWHEEEDES